MPKISIVLTTYNRKELLSETIFSILGQSFTDFELIIVDNFSHYDFPAHMSSFHDDRIIALQNQNNGIIAINRNYGIKYAQGDYIAFCDDDDLWNSDKLEKQIPFLNKDDIIGVATSFVTIGSSKFQSEKPSNNAQSINFSKAIESNIIPYSSLVIKNEINNYFNEDKQFVSIEDWDFQLNLLLKSKKNILLLPDKLISYRVHDHNAGMNTDQIEKGLLIIEKYKKYLNKALYRKAKFKVYNGLAFFKFKQGSKGSSIYFLKALLRSYNTISFLKCLLMIFMSLIPYTFQLKIHNFYYKSH